MPAAMNTLRWIVAVAVLATAGATASCTECDPASCEIDCDNTFGTDDPARSDCYADCADRCADEDPDDE